MNMEVGNETYDVNGDPTEVVNGHVTGEDDSRMNILPHSSTHETTNNTHNTNNNDSYNTFNTTNNSNYNNTTNNSNYNNTTNNSNYNGTHDASSYLDATLTTTHTIADKEEVPAKDYSTFPMLDAPPEIGSTIVYKVLELSPIHYTPELSEYREASVKGHDAASNSLELQLFQQLCNYKRDQAKGRFELPTDDEEEEKSPADDESTTVCLEWNSLVEPRLLTAPNQEEETFSF